MGYTEDIFSALDVQDNLQTRYTSGTVFHGFLGEKLPSWESAATLVRKIAENYKLPYYTLSPTYLTKFDHSEENLGIATKLGQPVTVCDTEGERWLQWSVDICSAELEKCLDFAAKLSEILQDLSVRCHWYLSSGNIVSGNMELVNGKETMYKDLSGPIENKKTEK